MKKRFGKLSSLAIVGLLMFTGCLDIFGSDDVIGNNYAPSAVVNVVSGQRVVDLGDQVQFDASESTDEDGTISSYSWDFGDGETGTGKNVIHRYQTPGDYIVSLSVTDNDGAIGNNDRRLTYITVLHGTVNEGSGLPHAIITVKSSVVTPGSTVDFNGAGSWAWLDGSPSTSEIADHEWGVGYWGLTTDNSELGSCHQIDDCSIFSYQFGSSSGFSKLVSTGSYVVELTVTSTSGETDTVYRTIRVVSEESSDTESPNPKVYTSVSIGDPVSLDPAEAYDTASGAILTNTYETLIFYDRGRTDQLIPVLAEEVPTVSNGGISPDGMTYTFKIRQGVTFHDGSELTAEDVVFSLNRMIIMDLAAGPSWMYTEVLDNTDEDGDGIADSIVQIDQYTVQFTLREPAPRFLPIMAYNGGSILSKDWVSSKGCPYPSPGVECTGIQKEVMGTGPYQMNEDYGGKWVPEQYVLMQYYPDYWRGWTDSQRQANGITTTGFIETVLLKKNNDQAARMLELRSGNADSVYVEPNYREEALTYDGMQYEGNLPSLSMGFIGFNHNISNYEDTAPSSDFFTNEDIRKGFCYSFDYDSYITDILDGWGKQPTGPIPDGLLGYDQNGPKYSYNPSMAQSHFEAAGVWDDGFTITAYYNLGNDVRLNALLLLENALEAMNPNFNVEVQGLEWPTYLDKLRAHELPLFFLGWAPDYADPHNYAHPFLHGEGHFAHYLGFQYDDIDELIMDAASESDESTRQSMYYDLADLEHDKALYIWGSQSIGYKIWREWVNGWYHNMMHSTLFYTLSKS